MLAQHAVRGNATGHHGKGVQQERDAHDHHGRTGCRAADGVLVVEGLELVGSLGASVRGGAELACDRTARGGAGTGATVTSGVVTRAGARRGGRGAHGTAARTSAHELPGVLTIGGALPLGVALSLADGLGVRGHVPHEGHERDQVGEGRQEHEPLAPDT